MGRPGGIKLQLKKLSSKFWASAVGPERAERMIAKIAADSGVDLLDIAHRHLGLLKSNNFRSSGELYLAKRIIPTFLPKFDPVLFDIGAHDGSYASLLASSVPNGVIYSFEPNPHSADKLRASLTGERYRIFEQGFSNKPERRELYIFSADPTSARSSVYREAIEESHRKDAEQVICGFDTIDRFCEANKILRIDFMKIDVEGHEFAVLEGAEKMIAAGMIGMIQFDFDEMNIVSRRFFKDFYELLQGYRLFRLDSHALLPIRRYEPRLEIFRQQNFFAIKEELAQKG